MTPEELLLKAADDIAEHGHHKETYSPKGADERTAPVCAYGAMTRVATEGRTTCYATEDSTLVDQAAGLLAMQIRPTFGVDFTFNRITYWNDAPDTTGEDVILAMKKAAHHD